MAELAEYPLPEVTPESKPYWDALDSGYLAFQRCRCGNAWLPARRECPQCLQDGAIQWERASGRGKIVSWVVYHTAYHDAFKNRLPYVVAIVQLTEGPRLISNFIGPREKLRIDLPVALVIERERGFALTRFAIAPP